MLKCNYEVASLRISPFSGLKNNSVPTLHFCEKTVLPFINNNLSRKKYIFFIREKFKSI